MNARRRSAQGGGALEQRGSPMTPQVLAEGQERPQWHRRARGTRTLVPEAMVEQRDRLYRSAWALRGSHKYAEDLPTRTTRAFCRSRACCTAMTSATWCECSETLTSAHVGGRPTPAKDHGTRGLRYSGPSHRYSARTSVRGAGSERRDRDAAPSCSGSRSWP